MGGRGKEVLRDGVADKWFVNLLSQLRPLPQENTRESQARLAMTSAAPAIAVVTVRLCIHRRRDRAERHSRECSV